MNKTNKIELKTQLGEIVDAVTPIIISASRSTDIPAFYAKWFINRLKKGYVKWINPFNKSAPQYISFENTKLIVFWTKNPKPLIPFLHELESRNINYYFQYTLNDYEKEKFEPNVPELSKRISTFKSLSETIGKEKVIWRFDPLIITNNINVRDLLKKVWFLGNELINHTNKLVFSFADINIYKKVQNNLIKETEHFDKNNISNSEFSIELKVEFAEGIKKILAEWKIINPNFQIATCAEDIDLEKFDINHNKCIDDDLIIKLFPNDLELMDFIGYKPQENLFGIETKKQLKDKGQRFNCGCIISKDIGSYDTCNHLCVYCYANTSKKAVANNLKRYNIENESIID